jgi:hypothetical protein
VPRERENRRSVKARAPLKEAPLSRTQISKQEALELLRKWGGESEARKAERELPDTIDLRRDQDLLARYGITRGQLMDRAGGSP